MKVVHMVAFILAVVGGINWGLVGLGKLVSPDTDWNVVHLILGSMPYLENIVYVLVGVAAIWLIIDHKRSCRECTASANPM